MALPILRASQGQAQQSKGHVVQQGQALLLVQAWRLGATRAWLWGQVWNSAWRVE